MTAPPDHDGLGEKQGNFGGLYYPVLSCIKNFILYPVLVVPVPVYSLGFYTISCTGWT